MEDFIKVKLIATRNYEDKVTIGRKYDGWYYQNALKDPLIYASMHFRDNHGNNSAVFISSAFNGAWFIVDEINKKLNPNTKTL